MMFADAKLSGLGPQRLRTHATLGALLCLAMAQSAHATPVTSSNTTPSQSTTPGTLAVAAGGIGTGGFDQGGGSILRDPNNNPGNFGMFAVGSPSYATVDTGGLNSSVTVSNTQSNTYGGLPYSDTSFASADFGHIHVAATSTGPNQVLFPQGAGQAGWTDRLTITAPGQSGSGTLVFTVHVDGHLHEDGPNGRPGFFITPYNQGSVVNRDAIFDAANPTPVVGSGTSLGYQSRVWFAPAVSNVSDLVVNENITFSVPFTFGQQFSLGLYAIAVASNGSFGAGTVDSVSSSDFKNTAVWSGVSEVLAGGQTVAYTINSASGVNWASSLEQVPEPASLALFGIGLLGMVCRRTKR